MTKKVLMWDITEDNTLRIEGVIAENAMWGDEITPCMFKDILSQRSGDITVWIDSPGGEVFAAIKIYNMLKEHNGKVTVKIDSLAASAATVIAMAGDEVLMAPGSMLFVHDPQCFAFGYVADLMASIEMLKEVKESALNVYELKTGSQRAKLSQFMTNETWLSAKKAVEWGFADGIMYKDENKPDNTVSAFALDSRAYNLELVNKLNSGVCSKELISELKSRAHGLELNNPLPPVEVPPPLVTEPPPPLVTEPPIPIEPPVETGTAHIQLEKRLNLIK